MKLKITDEKLRDELAQLHFLKNYEDDELATMSGCMGRIEPRFSGFCHGWDEATKRHQSKVDKLLQIVEMQNKYLKNAELEVNDIETWLYIDHKIASTQPSKLRKYIREVVYFTDKMLKELNDGK